PPRVLVPRARHDGGNVPGRGHRRRTDVRARGAWPRGRGRGNGHRSAVMLPRRRKGRLVAAAAVIAVAGVAWLRLGPLPAGLLDDSTRPSTIVTDRHGETLYEVRAADGLRGEWIDASNVPG